MPQHGRSMREYDEQRPEGMQEVGNVKNQAFHVRLRCALAGIMHGLRAERSFRTHTLAVFFVFVLLVVLRPSPIWWALVGLSTSSVLAAELFNSAIEHLADHLHPELHPTIRIVKDCAAGAVLVSVLGALLVAAALVVDLFARG